MRLLPTVLAAAMLTSPAFAGQIVFRPVTTGTLQFVAPPPELETPDPVEPQEPDFGVSYGVTNLRAGTTLSISPVWSSGHPQSEVTFASLSALPTGIVLDMLSGVIRGKIYVPGTYDFSVRVTDGTGAAQMVLVAIIVE
ncbi:hypothetical protein FHT87_002425 [Rhizobium sp. BK316]|uniref:putative Ig domain-containing protein n=1 Tax=Rhizobium sp. BK316 TaxID=2587053 RepID=UPI001611BD9F|nr:putative Ig domain-containing protein [Rhizobium sp. BK316]MBB3408522.1 hypothetical protein [Rhizobium sp. BK316]